MLLKDNEEKRNIAWRTVMTVTSVLIILIVVFFAVKLFTSNPLTGNWENTDDGMKLTIKNNGTMDIVQALDESTVSVPVDYTIDMEYKRFAIHVNEEKIAKQAEKTKDCSEQELQDIADVMEGTYEYSVEQNVLTLTDSEYGSQKTFEKKWKVNGDSASADDTERTCRAVETGGTDHVQKSDERSKNWGCCDWGRPSDSNPVYDKYKDRRCRSYSGADPASGKSRM